MKAAIRISLIITITLLININSTHAASTTTPNFRSLLLGYGTTVPGIGATTQKINTIELALRYGFYRKENTGNYFPKNTNRFIIELPIHIITGNEDAVMLGVNFLSMWSFNTQGRHHPYIFVGGGPLYISTNIEGMGRKLNGNYQFGAGLFFLNQGRISNSLELRFHHISNGSTAEPNVPLNGIKLLLGYHFR